MIRSSAEKTDIAHCRR